MKSGTPGHAEVGRMPRSDHDPLTEAVIGAAFTVHNVLGPGFLEKVYENAFAHELRKRGFDVVQQARVRVIYDGADVGEYVADLFVNSTVLVEIKAGRGLDDAHLAQCLNFLSAAKLKTGLLINYGKRVEVRRISKS